MYYRSADGWKWNTASLTDPNPFDSYFYFSWLEMCDSDHLTIFLMPQPKRFHIMTDVFMCSSQQPLFCANDESRALVFLFLFCILHIRKKKKREFVDMNLSDHLFVILALNTSSSLWFYIALCWICVAVYAWESDRCVFMAIVCYRSNTHSLWKKMKV